MSTIYAKITELKHELSGLEIKKSGHNKHLGFRYHELGDFLGVVSELNKKYGIAETVSINASTADLVLTNAEQPDEQIVISVPFVMADMQPKNDSIQKLGATLTYLRRYLYIQAYAITEHDVIDALNLKEKPVIDNEANAKKLFQHIINKTNEKDAPVIARGFLDSYLKVKSFHDIDFTALSLKEIIVQFNDWLENNSKESN
jgi:hypothetical protein